MRARNITLATAVLVALGCGRSEAPAAEIEPRTATRPAPHPRLAPRAARALDAPRLPEDPVAGARSTQQWVERRASRLRARQLTFDADHLADHRVLLEQITAARARYDKARSEAALSRTRAALRASLDAIQARMTRALDTGRGSRLLPDYSALHAALATSYPDAKLASLKGDAAALDAEQASFDAKLATMRTWLAEAEGELKSRELSQR